MVIFWEPPHTSRADSAAYRSEMIPLFDLDHVYALDIETDTSGGFGLDPGNGGITEIAMTIPVHEDRGVVFATADGMTEADVLVETDRLLYDLDPGLLSTWNGAFFDLPFIMTRAEILGVTKHLHLHAQAGLVPKYDPLPGHVGGYSATWGTRTPMPHQHLDVAAHYKRVSNVLRDRDEANGLDYKDRFRWSLKPVAEAHGITMISVDRERMHTLAPAERRAYALSDTNGTRLLAAHLLGHDVGLVDPLEQMARQHIAALAAATA